MTDAVHSSACPVCASHSGAPLLDLPGQPIYQHPVPADCRIEPPWQADLRWRLCGRCDHAWQPDVDSDTLARIYRNHYYTAAPDGIAIQFREEFIDQLRNFDLLDSRARAVLEIGGATGDMMTRLTQIGAISRGCIFEPNKENAAIARSRGFDVREAFFGSEIAADLGHFDLILVRHVIEHVFDFECFFAGMCKVCTSATDLILETPSLDWHTTECSLAPFHIEHVHVFSLASLTQLCLGYGWGLNGAAVTRSGNLIARFRRSQAKLNLVRRLNTADLRESVARQRRELTELCQGRKLIFWGAGSVAARLCSVLGRDPDYWVDSNPNKHGKRFVWSRCLISSPAEAIVQAMCNPVGQRPLLLIASSFASEILPGIREMGWDEAVFDMTGRLLSAAVPDDSESADVK